MPIVGQLEVKRHYKQATQSGGSASYSQCRPMDAIRNSRQC